jgi:hypothetical protein
MKKNDFLKIRTNTIRPLQLWGIECWVYLSVGFGKLNLVKDSKFWGVKIH